VQPGSLVSPGEYILLEEVHGPSLTCRGGYGRQCRTATDGTRPARLITRDRGLAKEAQLAAASSMRTMSTDAIRRRAAD
jgi:hypothetical protein